MGEGSTGRPLKIADSGPRSGRPRKGSSPTRVRIELSSEPRRIEMTPERRSNQQLVGSATSIVIINS
ncbi:hypothetical protein CP556_14990 [Natrinema sp. CBA1119]|nr:hypothetical protein CP556_14990 [Natrinema sp. CBA1119]